MKCFLFDPSTGEKITEPRNEWDKITIDACKGAIELLEQEPCDDAISREDAIKALQKVACYSAAIRARMIGAIEDLPSVTHKSGHWIHFAQSDNCSECGWSTGKYISPSKYCPNCGARMESEDKE